MAPMKPQQVAWDPIPLTRGGDAMSHTARRIEVMVEDGELGWLDPTIKQISDGNGPMEFAPVAAPEPYEELLTEPLGTALHAVMPPLTSALGNLAKQTRYCAEGVYRMAENQKYAEDANVTAVFDVMEKSLDRPGR